MNSQVLQGLSILLGLCALIFLVVVILAAVRFFTAFPRNEHPSAPASFEGLPYVAPRSRAL